MRRGNLGEGGMFEVKPGRKKQDCFMPTPIRWQERRYLRDRVGAGNAEPAEMQVRSRARMDQMTDSV